LAVLISFFIIVVLFIPGYFYYHLCAQEAKDIGGVKKDNRDIFKALLDDSMQGHNIPGILAQGRELADIKVRSKDELAVLQKVKSMADVDAAIP
jgi:hypothetical protein